ncbi:nuclease [Methylobacterium oxalidis]|uniref:nuclease n=1 Tax=Methylobacterium oxalidis TaxID=944322 RepID=UPI001EE03CCF|nr:nuclease [Methylobacterium oxalidis]
MPETASSQPTADERARLRARIRAAVEAARPQPVALRTLELMALAAAEPDASAAGYRIIDPRTGATRLREPAAEGAGPPADQPLSLEELVAELKRRHPALFLPDPPPEPASEPQALRPARKGGGSKGAGKRLERAPESASDVRAATARFVETQTVLARSLVANSSARGKALAARLGTSFGALRERLDARRAARDPIPDAPTTAGTAPEPAGAPWRERLGQARERIRDAFVADDGTARRRYLAGGLAAVLLAVGAAALVTGRQEPSERAAPADRAGGAAGPQSAPGAAPSQTGPQAPATPPAEPERAAAGEPPPAPANPNEIGGPAEVIDTATLRVGGKLVRLFGVEWVRGGQAEDLTRYLAGRSVTCQPVSGSQNVLCQVDGRDLSEVVLFNGGGRASPEATPDLVAAEDHARSERLGVWKR